MVQVAGAAVGTSADASEKQVALRAVGWMFGAVAGYALLPLLVWAGIRDMSPFFFVAMWSLVSAVVQGVVRQLQAGKRLGWEVPVMVEDLKPVKPVYLWWGIGLKFEWLLFTLAISLAGPVVATVIFEFWPAVLGLLTLTGLWRAKVLGGVAISDSGVSVMLALLVVGGIGVALAVMSQSTTIDWSGTMVLGLGLAALACVLTAIVTALFQVIGADQRDGFSVDRTVVATSAVAVALAASTPLIAVAGLVARILGADTRLWSGSGVFFACLAATVQVGGRWCFLRGNFLSHATYGQTGAQINTICYLVPVITLLLLAWLADTTIEHVGLLVAGVAVVVTTNTTLGLFISRKNSSRNPGPRDRGKYLSVQADGG